MNVTQSKVFDKACSGVSAGSKRKSGKTKSPIEVFDLEEPHAKRTKAGQIGVSMPFTNTTRTQKLTRVCHVVRKIYIEAH